jgi:hypothetical protein
MIINEYSNTMVVQLGTVPHHAAARVPLDQQLAGVLEMAGAVEDQMGQKKTGEIT